MLFTSSSCRVFGFVVAIVLGLRVPLYAAYFSVDSTADAHDASPGDAVCASAANGCTLRAAIEEANASAGLDFVQLSSDAGAYVRTIAGELSIADDIQLNGPLNVATIDAAGMERVLHVQIGVAAQLNNLTIRGGADASPAGGAGILNEGELTMNRVAVTENTGTIGAGVHNTVTGMLDAEGSYFSHNGPGASILNHGNVALERVAIERNPGFGLDNEVGGTGATLAYVDINHNDGGGIFNVGLATLDVRNSVLRDNTGNGALYNEGSATLRRSTVSGNTGQFANAIYSPSGTLVLEDTTVGANGSSSSSRGALEGTGAATIKALNSIVAGNASGSGDPDCRVTVMSSGHNLMSCALAAPDPTTHAGNPQLAPLRTVPVQWPSNMGTTMVHALLPGSDAIDTGNCLFADQRGVSRPEGAACDIGAVETPPLCRNGVGMTKTHMMIRRRSVADDTTKLRIRARLSFPNASLPTLDPIADGLQVRIEDLGTGASVLERTTLTDPLTVAWRGGTPRFKWKIEPDPLTVFLTDKRASSAYIDLKTGIKTAMPQIVGPLRVTVVLGGNPIDGNAAGDAGACAEQVFTCTSDAAHTTFKCT